MKPHMLTNFRKTFTKNILVKRISLPCLALVLFLVLSVFLTACDSGSGVALSGTATNPTSNLVSLPLTTVSNPPPTAPEAAVTTPVPVPTSTNTPPGNPVPSVTPVFANTPTPAVVNIPLTTTPTTTKPAESSLPTTTAQPALEAPASGALEDYKPVIWFSAATLKPGDTLTVSGNGYPPNTELNVALGFNSAAPAGSYAKPKSDDKGRFSVQIKLDKDTTNQPVTPGRLVIAVSTPDQKIAAGAPVTLLDTATKPTTTAKPTVSQSQGRNGKWIDVSLSKQKLTAYDGDKVIYSSLISSGVARFPTVIGTYSIYLKYEKQTMVGGRGSDAYNLPNVPYVMYFYQDYGIHGTYWHSNFGRPMSHGCVNTPTDVARLLYNWAPIGTPVVIHN